MVIDAIDLGGSFAPSLSRRISSPGNYLGPEGVSIMGSAAGIFATNNLKD